MTIYTSPLPDIALSELTVTERLFEGIAQDKPVLIDGPTGRALTGAAFINGVKAFAGGLGQRGMGPGCRVALMAPNLPEYCVVFHGVCWAGGTITTINPTYTAPEVTHQLNDAGAEILVTIGMFLDVAKAAVVGTNVKEIVVIGDAAEGATALSDFMGPPQEAQAKVDIMEHIAVLPYSSGTTGLPKGVMLTHRNLVANIDQIIGSAGLEENEVTVAFLPFFHIFGLQVCMNMYLAAGCTVVTMPRFDLEMYLDLCSKHKTPKLWVVPPVALALAKHPLVDQYDMSAIKQLLSGAAPLGGDISDAVAARLGGRAVQGYGMTELSPVSHLTPLDQAKSGSSGITISNTECRIVDPETMSDVPVGHNGELWVRGPQVMKGYLNNPKATAETILEDGWLRTGDIGHIDEGGFMFITDRLKELIKYKGFQVAPAELEAQLVTHPDIVDAAVVGKPDDDAGELPVAFVVAAPEASVPPLEDVQSYLAERLAHYKQIQIIHTVDEIPKSASGKILRRLLRDRLN